MELAHDVLLFIHHVISSAKLFSITL